LSKTSQEMEVNEDQRIVEEDKWGINKANRMMLVDFSGSNFGEGMWEQDDKLAATEPEEGDFKMTGKPRGVT
jgi:hypothetical protein